MTGRVSMVALAAEILVIEDDPEMADLLAAVLAEEGYRTSTAPDGVTALDLVARGVVHPDLLLADFNLPNGMNGIRPPRKFARRCAAMSRSSS